MSKTISHKKIVLIGAGNVATHLGLALDKAGHSIEQVFSRTERSAKTLANKFDCEYTTQLNKLSPNADIYIIAVKDDIIERIISKIDEKLKDKLFIHTSGSISINVFEKRFSNVGVFYPLQTFSKERIFQFKNIPVCVEANTQKNAHQLYDLASSISNNVHFVNSEERKKIHLAAVFASNFTNYMYTVAAAILKNEKLAFDLLVPLVEETVAKAIKLGPAKSQTGPAMRKDEKVMKAHLKLLSGKKELKNIYEQISNEIGKLN